MIMLALEEEKKLSIEGGEGPFGICLCPSRELARQTWEVIDRYCEALGAPGTGYPRLRSQLITGGEAKKEQIDAVQRNGVHCVVATPGRLKVRQDTLKFHHPITTTRTSTTSTTRTVHQPNPAQSNPTHPSPTQPNSIHPFRRRTSSTRTK